MDKQELLHEVRQLAAAHAINQGELLTAFAQGQGTVVPEENKHITLSQVLYYIGGAIVFVGICVLISQNWEYFNTATKILVTLGSGIAAYVVGVLFNRYEQYKGLGLAFFLISALVNPIGLYVMFDKLGFDTGLASVGVLVFLILLVVYLGSYFIFRKTIFTLFSIVFGTALFFLLVQWMVGVNFTYADQSKIWEYRFLVAGMVYMLLGYYFKDTSESSLAGPLYAFGSLGFLGAALALGNWQPNQNVFWELIYPLLVFGIIFLSVYIKSKSFLVFGSLFLIGYILKLTSEYFSSGLGWPLALVLAGLLIMVVGYYAVRINKEYLTTATLK
jgi:hypothetical protein